MTHTAHGFTRASSPTRGYNGIVCECERQQTEVGRFLVSRFGASDWQPAVGALTSLIGLTVSNKPAVDCTLADCVKCPRGVFEIVTHISTVYFANDYTNRSTATLYEQS